MEQLNQLAKDLGGMIPPKKPGKETKGLSVGGNPTGDPMVDVIKKWLLIGLSGLIVSGAVILIVLSLIRKVG